MTIRSQLEWAIKLPIPCPKCGHESMETVACLKEHDETACESCRATIDLTSKEWRAYVDQFAKALSELRPIYKNLP